MDYEKIYERLIATRKNRTLIPGVYYEKHHIVPRALGGKDNKENLISLTPKEHFRGFRDFIFSLFVMFLAYMT